jgi:hypothetical protein
MTNGVFTIDWEGVKSALVSVVLMALLSVLLYVIGVGDLWQLDMRSLVNIGVISLFTGIVSLIKNFLTSDEGKFLGLTKIG